jgi:hypothetical protein
MKRIAKFITKYISLSLAALFLFGCTTNEYGSRQTESVVERLSDISHDGLVRLEDAKADVVWVLPGVDFSVYKRIALAEPQIAFRDNYMSDINSGRMLYRIDEKDMMAMVSKGKELFYEEFSDELTKGGYTLVNEPAEDVLLVKAAILDLDVAAPDVAYRSAGWVEVYSEGAGSATFVIELYDSVTGQIITRAVDSKRDYSDIAAWRMPRTRTSNIADARSAFSDWARMLVNGLERARSAQ